MMSGTEPAEEHLAAQKVSIELCAPKECGERSARRTIVVVDDSRSSLAQLSKLVREMKVGRCVPFDDPSKASAVLTSLCPALVLVDYEMPGMSGIEFVRWMRDQPVLTNTPVVMITGHADRDLLRTALEAGAHDFIRKPVDPFELRPRVENLLKLSDAQQELRRRADWLASEVMTAAEVIQTKENEIIYRLARAVEFRDPDTGAHIRRIAAYSALMGRELGMDAEQRALLELAAPLHDVGKIAVPDSILLKPGELTSAERAQMQQHTLQGHHVLKDSSSRVLQVAAEIALSHHERWDGTGYPYGLKGYEIPLTARIVAVADVFDALTTERSYKQPWSIEAARAFMVENSGTQFDPDCIQAFIRCWPVIEKTWGTVQN
jgi:putative two-component system response regulator